MSRPVWSFALVAPLLFAACRGGDSSSTSSDAVTVKVSVSDEGCAPAVVAAKPGKTRFVVSNRGSAAVTEYEILDGKKIIGEVEGVTPGADRSFTMTLRPGTFTTYCPNGTKVERGQLVVAAS